MMELVNDLSPNREQLLVRDEIVAAPAKRACKDQSFELPTAIYIAMATMFASFIAVLRHPFRGGHMAVVYGVIFAFIAAFFAVPAPFPRRQAPQDSAQRRRSACFDFGQPRNSDGDRPFECREATILVLLLPFLILCFGIAVATIAVLTSIDLRSVGVETTWTDCIQRWDNRTARQWLDEAVRFEKMAEWFGRPSSTECELSALGARCKNASRQQAPAVQWLG